MVRRRTTIAAASPPSALRSRWTTTASYGVGVALAIGVIR